MSNDFVETAQEDHKNTPKDLKSKCFIQARVSLMNFDEQNDVKIDD